jgi:hypothetical protein
MTDKKDDIGQSLEDISKKLQIDIDVLRKVSPREMQYLLDMCPFLQIVDTVLHYTDQAPPEVQFIEARSGWKILDYGDAMTASPGEHILGLGGYRRVDEDGDESGGGHGTIWNQAFLTATEMVEIAQARGWKGIQMIDGHRVMRRGAWIKALAAGLPVSGFKPTQEDERVRQRVEMDDIAYQTFRHQVQPK